MLTFENNSKPEETDDNGDSSPLQPRYNIYSSEILTKKFLILIANINKRRSLRFLNLSCFL